MDMGTRLGFADEETGLRITYSLTDYRESANSGPCTVLDAGNPAQEKIRLAGGRSLESF